MSKPVVMLCPYFAPSANIASKRAVRFARHLGSAGWEPIVLTMAGSAGGGLDPSELEALPAGLRVERTYATGPLWAMWRRWEETKARVSGKGVTARPMSARQRHRLDRLLELTFHWTPVDRFLPYTLGAARSAATLACDVGAAAIYATSYPFSALMAGILAGRRAGLPVLLDLRDPWTLDPLYHPPKPWLWRRLAERLEAWCFTHASRVLLNTERAKAAYDDRYPELASRFFALHNGFDRSQFRAWPAVSYDGFTLVHFGNFHDNRTIGSLIRALLKLPFPARVVTYGTFRRQDLELAERLGLSGRLEMRTPVAYRDTMTALRGAGALLLVQGGEGDLKIPGKLYDYLCAGRPILALTGNPEVAEILRATGSGVALDAANEDAIVAAVTRLARGEVPPPAAGAADRFDAVAQTRELASHLDAIVGDLAPSRSPHPLAPSP